MAAAFMVVFMVAMGTRDAMDFMGGPITGVFGVTPITGDTIILPSTVMKVMGEHTAGDTDKKEISSIDLQNEMGEADRYSLRVFERTGGKAIL